MRDRYEIPDPKCLHRRTSVRVSSHSNLARVAIKSQKPIASVWVCDREACIEDAMAWVRAMTQRDPLVYRKKDARARAQV